MSDSPSAGRHGSDRIVRRTTLPVLRRPDWLTESAWPWRTRVLDHRTGRIAVTVIGRGPVLLFVHVGTWSFVWRDVLRRLQSEFCCISIDPPGSGLSERSTTAPTLGQVAEVITAVIDTLQLQDVTMVVHDIGGPVGFLAASRRPDAVAALAAVNCFAWRPTGVFFRGMLALMGSALMRETDARMGWLPAVTSTRFGVGRHLSRSDRKVFRAGIDASARRAWHHYFREARGGDELFGELDTGLSEVLKDRPLTTVFGQFNDPLRFQRRWKVLFPAAQQLKVPKGNHFPMCDDPDLVAEALRELVRRKR